LLAVAVSCQWSAPRGDLAGTSSNAGTTGLGIDVVGALTERWRGPVGVAAHVPVLRGNTVVVASGTRLVAFDATGCGQAVCAPIWQDDGVFGQPTIDGDLVYVTKGSYPAAYDLRGGPTCSGAPRHCGPRWTGTEAALWVLAGHGIVVATGTEDSWVYDAGDGSGCDAGACSPTRRLDPPPCDWMFGCTSSLAAIGAGVIAFGFEGADEWEVSGDLAVYDLAGVQGCVAAPGPDRCAPLWHREVGKVSSSPAIVGTTIVVDGVRWRFDDVAGTYGLLDHRVSTFATDGSPGWSRSDPSAVDGELAVADGTVFDADGRTLRALDLDTGALEWSTRFGAVINGVSEAEGVLYVATTLGVFALDGTGTIGCGGVPKTCSPVASVAGARSFVPAAISNGRVWVIENDQLRSFGIER